MKYIYIDESGDFGFSKKSTKAVIIAAIFTDSPAKVTHWFNKIKRRKVPKKEIDQTMFWYFDRRTLKNISWDTVKQSVRNKLILLSTEPKNHFEIHQADSKRNINLQFADFMAYAIFRSKCMNDSRWFNLIKKHIRRVNELDLK